MIPLNNAINYIHTPIYGFIIISFDTAKKNYTQTINYSKNETYIGYIMDSLEIVEKNGTQSTGIAKMYHI